MVFQDYSQVDGQVQRRQKGTGLGLPLTRKLAMLLGGTVNVASTPGVGSNFTIRLPMTLPSLPPLQSLPPLPSGNALNAPMEIANG